MWLEFSLHELVAEFLLVFFPFPIFTFSLIPSEILFHPVQFADEVKYVKSSTEDRTTQLRELHVRLDETAITDSNQKKAFEDEIQSSLNVILASDDNRRSSFQLAYDEQQQIVAVSMQNIVTGLFLLSCFPHRAFHNNPFSALIGQVDSHFSFSH